MPTWAKAMATPVPSATMARAEKKTRAIRVATRRNSGARQRCTLRCVRLAGPVIAIYLSNPRSGCISGMLQGPGVTVSGETVASGVAVRVDVGVGETLAVWVAVRMENSGPVRRALALQSAVAEWTPTAMRKAMPARIARQTRPRFIAGGPVRIECRPVIYLTCFRDPAWSVVACDHCHPFVAIFPAEKRDKKDGFGVDRG